MTLNPIEFLTIDGKDVTKLYHDKLEDDSDVRSWNGSFGMGV